MPLPSLLPPCRPIVLAADASPDELETTLRALLADEKVDRPIEVFAARTDAFPELADATQLRWHAPESALPAALSRLSDLDADVAWVVAGVRVPPGGLHRLQATLHAEPRIGSASPLCATDPLYSPADAGRPLPMHPDALDDWLQLHASPLPVELPAPLACCGVLRHEAIAALPDGPREGAKEWPQALSRAGWLHVACTRVLVDALPDSLAADVASQGALDNTLLAARKYWHDAHPLTGLRWKIGKAVGATRTPAIEREAPPGPAPRAIRLHLAHSWGGGLSTWVSDFCDADKGAENLVLRSIGVIGAYGQRLALYRGSESVEPLRVWELGLPIHATAIAHLQYRSVLREIAADFGVDCVIVSSLIGHSLDALRTGLPTVLVAHDHYPFCVAIFAFHGGECRSCDRTRLADCLARNPGHRFFADVSAGDWIALRDAFCAAVREEAITIVAPSPSVRERWRALMPTLEGARIEVIGHALSLGPAVPFEPPDDGPLRLIKLGRLSMEKGGEVLEAILPELSSFAHLTLLGCGDEAARLGRLPGVTAIPGFTRDELPALVAKARPHLGLQLSVVPETFSYTLSELWHCGVPVLASRIGSLADRIRDGENGYLVETTGAAVLTRLRQVDAERDALAGLRARVLAAPTRTREQMVTDYLALFPSDRKRRTPLAPGGVGVGADEASNSGRVALGPISVDPEVTYLRAARAFARYTLEKAANSPRLPRPIRRLLGGH